MGLLAQRINAASVKVGSPDRTVRASLGNGHGLRIEFPQGLDTHNEASLSTQLTLVCTQVARRYKQVTTAIVRQTIAQTDTDEDDTFDNDELNRPSRPTPQQERFESAVAKISLRGLSPRSAVTVHQTPGETVELLLSKGSLNRWTADQIAAEVTAALSAAAADHQRQTNRLLLEHLETIHSSQRRQP